MNEFELNLRIDAQRETIGRLLEEAEGYRERISELEDLLQVARELLAEEKSK